LKTTFLPEFGKSSGEGTQRQRQKYSMNCEVFYLKELEVEHYQIREVLRCILHTIMFNRALGLVRPREVDSELFEITYVQCGDAATEKKIEEKIDLFLAWVEKHPNKKSQVCFHRIIDYLLLVILRVMTLIHSCCLFVLVFADLTQKVFLQIVICVFFSAVS
jgi:hypothetical protein